MFRYIRIHHIFASIASKYSHKFSYKYSIWCKINTCWSVIRFRANNCFNIFSYWRIFPSKYLFWSKHSQNFKRNLHSSWYSLANIRIQANVCFQIFAYKRMFASQYLHQSEYLLSIASNYIGKPFHRSLILGLKPVLFVSKQRNICFIFAYIHFEPNIRSALYTVE